MPRQEHRRGGAEGGVGGSGLALLPARLPGTVSGGRAGGLLPRAPFVALRWWPLPAGAVAALSAPHITDCGAGEGTQELTAVSSEGGTQLAGVATVHLPWGGLEPLVTQPHRRQCRPQAAPHRAEARGPVPGRSGPESLP